MSLICILFCFTLIFVHKSNCENSTYMYHHQSVYPHDPLDLLREMVDVSGIMAETTRTNIKPSLQLLVAGSKLHESPHVHHHWNEYVKAHNKIYHSVNEQIRRRQWIENIIRVHHHNELARKGERSFYLGVNHLADMNVKEYLKKMTKLTHDGKADPDEAKTFTKRDIQTPAEFNWIEKGLVMPDWDQGDCGSCYAFSIAASAEGQHFRKTNELINLSAQQLVDCSVAVGNRGCRGGSLRKTLRYCLRSRGLMAESDYPYKAQQQGCHFHAHQRKVNVTSYVILPENDELAIEKAVATVGPVACSVNASPYTFQLYHKGIYDDPNCSSSRVNHAMLIVGYTKDAWILKNWWGKNWGMNGYMLLKRGVNRCAVAKYAGYPIVETVPLLETISHL